MSEKLEQFLNDVAKSETIYLATCDGSAVTMRVISPVVVDGKILFFTNSKSNKFRQLEQNADCCIASGYLFAQATAKLCGKTLSPENKPLRDAYCAKFPGAFDEGMEFGGREDDFVLLTLTHLSGWVYPEKSDLPIPTIPFDIQL